MERDAPLMPAVLAPLREAGPNSSDMVHTRIRRQQPKSRPEIKVRIDISKGLMFRTWEANTGKEQISKIRR